MKQKQTPEPEFEKRTKSVKVNLTESEYKAYCKKAKELGATITARVLVLAYTRGEIKVGLSVGRAS